MAREMSRGEIDELLSGQFVVRLGCHEEHQSYVVPVACAWDGEAVVGFSYEGRKLTAMRRNRRVCVEADEVEHFGKWRSVIGWGQFEELAGEARDRAKELLASHLTPHVEDEESRRRLASAMRDDPAPVVFRIRLDEMTGRAEER